MTPNFQRRLRQASKRPWKACHGDIKSLMHRGKRACFPHVHLGDMNRGFCPRSRGDFVTMNAGGGPMTEHDANAVLVGVAVGNIEMLVGNLLQYVNLTDEAQRVALDKKALALLKRIDQACGEKG